MTVFKTKIFNGMSRGASLIEVILTISIIAVAAPFMYRQIQSTHNDIENISVAQRIVDLQNDTLNFIRSHQENWPGEIEIVLTEEDLKEITPYAVAGIVDQQKYMGTIITDVYLAFNITDSAVRANQIARQIGSDAAVVGDDGIAYGNNWAVAAPQFKPGYLIYRISHNFSAQDRTNFLHRGATDATTDDKKKKTQSQNETEDKTDKLNAMFRNLNMGGKDILNVGTLDADAVSAKNTNATFVRVNDAYADSIYFSSGANIQGTYATLDTIRALGDISGFSNITADNLNGNSFSNVGTIIADKATVKKSVRIGNLFKIKSSTSRTISSFTAISSNSVYAPYVNAGDMIFYGDFGITVSGELLVSGVAPLKIGNWSFPSNQMPKFTNFKLGHAKISPTPNKDEFNVIMSSDWRTIGTAAAQK